MGAKLGYQELIKDKTTRKNIHRLINNKKRLNPEIKMVDANPGEIETVINPSIDDIDEVIVGLTKLRSKMQ